MKNKSSEIKRESTVNPDMYIQPECFNIKGWLNLVLVHRHRSSNCSIYIHITSGPWRSQLQGSEWRVIACTSLYLTDVEKRYNQTLALAFVFGREHELE